MPKCLVTGGAGFIGSHLVEGLLQRGDQVRVLDDLSTGKLENLSAWQNDIEILQGSLTNTERLDQAVRDCEVIYHLGAMPSVAQSIEQPMMAHAVNATGTLKVLDKARQHNVRRVVYAATCAAYGNIPGSLRTEDDPLSPLTPYAAAKLAGEHYCSTFTAVYGLETVRLRFFNIFGPRQDASSPYSGVIAIFINLMRQGKIPRIDGDGEQTRDFVYVGNCVQAVMKAATAPTAVGNVYNIGNGASTSILQLVANLNQILDTNITPTHGAERPGDVRHSQADITRARRDLGYEPDVDFAEGLRRTVAWYAEN